MKEVVPYKQDSKTKKEQVAEMFNNISPKYDFLNHFLSLGIDIQWRKKAVKILQQYNPKTILDIATGTADFALMAMKTKPDNITGVDISEGMINVGKEKITKKNLQDVIQLEIGDSENLRFEDESFDAAIVAFGVRNFENLEKGLAEIHRVLKKDGVLIVLEFSKPKLFPFKQIYNFYFHNILPLFGKLVSKDNSAYTYLPESVSRFPDGEAFLEICRTLKYNKCKAKTLTLGISTIYICEK